MPHDRWRSVLSRPFLTCDDPEGVIECGSIRKYKTDSKKMKQKIDGQTAPNQKTKSSLCKQERKEMVSLEPTREASSPASLQLLQVSRGAEKLNRMIETWSKGMSPNRQSKDAASDLLKGTLELQESLVMLGKLQEASKYMSKLKKREEMERVESRRFDKGKNERTEFGDVTGFKEPRLSDDGYSRSSPEELKKVIKDSIVGKNCKEKAYFDTRNMDFASDIPSTSSSQSSIVNSNSSCSTGSSCSSISQQKRNGTNLIAKLMGLEELPSNSLQTAPQKHLKDENICLQRSVSDINIPRTRKPFDVEKNEPRRKSLEEIIDTMKIQGFLERTHKCHKSHAHYASTPCSRERVADDFPPIVLMKPLHFTSKEFDPEPIRPSFTRKDEALDFNMRKEVEAEYIQSEKLLQENQAICFRMEAESTEGKVKRNYPHRSQPHSPPNYSLHKKEMVEKKPRKIRIVRSKQVEEKATLTRVLKSQHTKVIPAREEKIENNPNAIKKQSSLQQHISTKRVTQAASGYCNDKKSRQLKKEKPVKDLPVPEANLVTDSLRQREEKQIDEDNYVPSRRSNCLVDPLSPEEESNASKIPVKGWEEASRKLILGCANELIEDKRLRESLFIHPLAQPQIRNQKACYSLNHLLEEVCEGFENFRSYTKLVSENLSINSLNAMVEGELQYRGVLNGVWDLGWRHQYSVDEVEEVMAGVEKLVLGGLLEELSADFL